MAVEAVDARDEEAFAAWFAVLDASAEHERPGEPHWSLQEQRELALAGLPDDPSAAVEQHLLLDRDAAGPPGSPCTAATTSRWPTSSSSCTPTGAAAARAAGCWRPRSSAPGRPVAPR